MLCFLPSIHYPLYDFDLRSARARTLLPAALTSVSFGFVLVRVLSSIARVKRGAESALERFEELQKELKKSLFVGSAQFSLDV